MKKFTALFLSLVLLLGLAACGGMANVPSPTAVPAAEPTAAPAEPASPAEAAETDAPSAGEAGTESGKTLVVYFSATGSTRRVAGERLCRRE